MGGFAQVFHEVGTTIEEDLFTAEMIALPITLVLLVLIFGSVVAASLPLLIGIMSIFGTFFVLQVLSGVTDVSIYALNLTTAMGLGLAIDYSLFVVSRYREELRAGHDPRPAVVRTVRTAGRTVAFSALTVAASLCVMLVFPVAFLRSFAYAGVAVALLAGVFSVVVLPAILALLGHRVNALTLWRRSLVPPEQGVWHRIARFVMRRPVPVATGAIAVLLLLGAPFLGLRLTQPDDRVLPPGAEGRVVGDVIREEFSSEEAGALSVVPADEREHRDSTAETDAYAVALARLPGVSRVDAATGTYCGEGVAAEFGCEPGQLVLGPDSAPRYAGFTAAGYGSYLSVVPSVEPYSAEGEDLVHAVRDTDAPYPVLVTGQSAELVDLNGSLFARLPIALGLIAVITVGAAVHDVRQRDHPGQGHRAEPAQPVGHVRGHGVDLPGRAPVGGAGLHGHRRPGGGHAHPHVLHRLRAVDGLRGVPPVPHQGGARPRRRQRDVGGRGPGAHRSHRDRGGGADRGDVRVPSPSGT